MDLSANRHNPSHVADDFEDSSVEDEPYAYQYNEAEQGDEDGNDDPHSQKRSIKKWTAEEVNGFLFALSVSRFMHRYLDVLFTSFN